MSSYATILRTPGLARVFGASLTARMANGALGLLLVLRVREFGGSYALGGLVSAAFAVGLAGAAPLIGRVVDRRGQTRVLLTTASVMALALTALALLPGHPPTLALVALAMVAGAAVPPVSSCLRALWDVLLPDPRQRHTALALDASSFEATYVVVPAALLVVAAWSASAALLVAAATTLVGTIGFSLTGPSRRWRSPADGAEHGMLGALASPGVRVLLGVWLMVGAGVGAVEVGIAAFAEDHGQKDLTGPLLAAWGLASMVLGFVAGRLHPPDPVRRFLWLTLAVAVGNALLAVAWSPASLAPLLLLAGAGLAPSLTIGLGLLGRASLPGTLTEASTWLVSGLGAGLALGAALGGVLIDADGAWLSFLLAGLANLAAVAMIGIGGRALRTSAGDRRPTDEVLVAADQLPSAGGR